MDSRFPTPLEIVGSLFATNFIMNSYQDYKKKKIGRFELVGKSLFGLAMICSPTELGNMGKSFIITTELMRILFAKESNCPKPLSNTMRYMVAGGFLGAVVAVVKQTYFEGEESLPLATTAAVWGVALATFHLISEGIQLSPSESSTPSEKSKATDSFIFPKNFSASFFTTLGMVLSLFSKEIGRKTSIENEWNVFLLSSATVFILQCCFSKKITGEWVKKYGPEPIVGGALGTVVGYGVKELFPNSFPLPKDSALAISFIVGGLLESIRAMRLIFIGKNEEDKGKAVFIGKMRDYTNKVKMLLGSTAALCLYDFYYFDQPQYKEKIGTHFIAVLSLAPLGALMVRFLLNTKTITHVMDARRGPGGAANPIVPHTRKKK